MLAAPACAPRHAKVYGSRAFRQQAMHVLQNTICDQKELLAFCNVVQQVERGHRLSQHLATAHVSPA